MRRACLALLLLSLPAFATDVTVRMNWIQKPGRQIAPITMDLEDYVAGVLAGEAANFRSPAALQAMAVAIRTYAIYNRGRHKKEGFDFCDTTHCQDYHEAGQTARLKQAAQSTAGELLWFEGSPADTYYTKSCGGQREAVSNVWPQLKAPYLKAQPDPYCNRKGNDEWKRELSFTDIAAALQRSGLRVPQPLLNVTVSRLNSTARVSELKLNDTVPVAASSFRFALGRALGWDSVPSDWYTITKHGNKIHLHGRSVGHGIGLCQRGASIMGDSGASYAEILSFYYPGTSLGLTAQGFRWKVLTGERGELYTTQPEKDRDVLLLLDRLLPALEKDTGIKLKQRPQVRIYPTVATFRDATAQPGWVAASSHDRIIDLQPASALRDALRPTLRHELAHLLIEGENAPALPFWFREGVVLAFTEPVSAKTLKLPEEAALNRALRQPATEAARRLAYHQAQAAALACIRLYGKTTVLRWATHGLPPTLTYASISQAVTSSR